jgi:FkbH-like protein
MQSDGQPNREKLRAAVAAQDLFRAMQAARALLLADASLRNASFVNRECAALKAKLTPVRVALLSSFSAEFLTPSVKAYGYASGLAIEIYQAPFGNYAQEILDRASGLYRFKPDVVVLALEGRDVAPQLYDRYYQAVGQPQGFGGNAAVDDIAGLATDFRQSSDAMLLAHNFAQPAFTALGIADAGSSNSQRRRIAEANAALAEQLRGLPGAYVVDVAGLTARFGAAQWYDNRMAHYAKAPIAATMLPHLAQEYLRFIRAKYGKAKKCVVVDLDNTLWGGVLGEEGVAGVKLGANYPGSAFVEFQHAILALRQRGVILAIASKNNPADVDEIFAKHPHMVLKREHFAAAEIHWREKTESLKAIAAKLNIGLEHMVFADDNPVECERVQQELPQVTTILLPAQPELYADLLFAEGLFDVPSLSAEDLKRAELYRTRAQAETLLQQATNLEDFYRGLQMRITFEPVTKDSLARAAQLTQKTNQFNATTRRLSEAEIQARMDSPEWFCANVKVADRFGDHGIVGLMLARVEGEELVLDIFLMSCRVIGRTVETSMLACLYDEACARGLLAIRATVIPTAKNAPVRDVFERHGFAKAATHEAATEWVYEVAQAPLQHPEWFEVHVEQAARAMAR